jgi:hypothetical protein
MYIHSLSSTWASFSILCSRTFFPQCEIRVVNSLFKMTTTSWDCEAWDDGEKIVVFSQSEIHIQIRWQHKLTTILFWNQASSTDEEMGSYGGVKPVLMSLGLRLVFRTDCFQKLSFLTFANEYVANNKVLI